MTDWTVFFVLLAATLAAGATGSVFAPGTWYRALEKPAFTPPNWAFPVAWTTLYVCMSLAGARIATTPEPALPLALWALQIALNTLWTPVFFGAHRIRFGLVILGLLWLTVACATYVYFGRDIVAGLLMVPYIAWLTIAFALNFSIWRLNPMR